MEVKRIHSDFTSRIVLSCKAVDCHVSRHPLGLILAKFGEQYFPGPSSYIFPRSIVLLLAESISSFSFSLSLKSFFSEEPENMSLLKSIVSSFL